MAVSLTGLNENIEVIISIDPAVHCSPEEYSAYLEDLNEGRLNLNGEEPTRFAK